jgi:very-short-patch-repair endonuclease
MKTNTREHNREIMRNAQFRAEEMKIYPSPLEERMMAFLDTHGIMYKSQYIFYIFKGDWIVKYYIADFYLPEKKIIIEVDGKFHDQHKLHDKQRTKDIQEQYPGIEILRYRWNDFNDDDTMRNLLHRIGNV